VLAAPPNRLEAPAANPSQGNGLTLFHVSVRYVSVAGNAASSVSARIGTLDLPMRLTGGTSTNGTWSGSTVLPVGTWTTTFQATTLKGPSPTLAGPSLTVLGAASPTPNGRPGDEPAPSFSGGSDTGDPGGGPAVTPAAGPAESEKPRPGAGTPDPAPRGGGGGGRSETETSEPAPRGSGDASTPGRRRGGGAPLDPGSSGAPAAEEIPLGGEGTDTPRGDLLLLLVGIVGVATVALLGTGWLLASRERDGEAAEPAETVAGLRARRARRTAGIKPAHDPVLAAMGLDEVDDAVSPPARGGARGAAPRPRKGPPGSR
jgi:hypothetical protein